MKTILFLLLFLPTVCFGEDLRMNMLGCSYSYVISTMKKHGFRYELEYNKSNNKVITYEGDDAYYMYIFDGEDCIEYKYVPNNIRSTLEALEENCFKIEDHWVTYNNPPTYWHIKHVESKAGGTIYIFINTYEDIDLTEKPSL